MATGENRLTGRLRDEVGDTKVKEFRRYKKVEEKPSREQEELLRDWLQNRSPILSPLERT